MARIAIVEHLAGARYDMLAFTVAVVDGITPCHVLGLFQETDGESYYPVFVCELNDGRVLTAVTSEVRFTDTEGGIIS